MAGVPFAVNDMYGLKIVAARRRVGGVK